MRLSAQLLGGISLGEVNMKFFRRDKEVPDTWTYRKTSQTPVGVTECHHCGHLIRVQLNVNEPKLLECPNCGRSSGAIRTS